MRIRSAARPDREAILSVVASAFGRDDEARLVERLWSAGAMACETVAEDGGKVIGYCACSPVTLTPAIDQKMLGLAPVAVTPERQREGAGSALVKAILEQARRDGVGAIVVLGHKDYYPRFGFRPASSRNVRWDARDAGDAFQLIEFAPVLDGAPREARYHPAFYET